MNEVSNFTSFDVYLGTLGEVHQKWSGAEELVFALGKEPVYVVGVSASVRLIAGDERGGGVSFWHRWGDELHCNQDKLGFRGGY